MNQEQEEFFNSTLSLEQQLQILDTYKDFGRNASVLVAEVLGNDTPKPDNPSRIDKDIGSYRFNEFLNYKKVNNYVRSRISVHELLGKLFAKNKEETKQIVLERAGLNHLKKFEKYCKCCTDYGCTRDTTNCIKEEYKNNCDCSRFVGFFDNRNIGIDEKNKIIKDFYYYYMNYNNENKTSEIPEKIGDIIREIGEKRETTCVVCNKKKKNCDCNLYITGDANKMLKKIKQQFYANCDCDKNNPLPENSSSESKYCNLYKEFYSLANDYDEKKPPQLKTKSALPGCRERLDSFITYPDIDINTTKADGLLVINNVNSCMKNTTYGIIEKKKVRGSNKSLDKQLCEKKKKEKEKENFKYSMKYKIDLSSESNEIEQIEQIEKNIKLEEIVKTGTKNTEIPSPYIILNDIIKTLIQSDKTTPALEALEKTTKVINTIFNLNYENYKDSEDKRKIYIKCLFDFKRLGDLQLIKVAADKKIPFITGDRLAAIIANRCYGVTSVFIHLSNVELHEKHVKNGKNEFTVTFYTIEDTIKHLLEEINTIDKLYNNRADADTFVKGYIKRLYTGLLLGIITQTSR
jgi:hypothetical protein